MNLVIGYGKIVSEIDFKFIYNRYKDDSFKGKYNHTSIAKCKIDLLNSSIVEIYGYDEVADYMYKNLKFGKLILIEGRLNEKIKIEVKRIRHINLYCLH